MSLTVSQLRVVLSDWKFITWSWYRFPLLKFFLSPVVLFLNPSQCPVDPTKTGLKLTITHLEYLWWLYSPLSLVKKSEFTPLLYTH